MPKLSLPHPQSETQRPLSCSRCSAIRAAGQHQPWLAFNDPFLFPSLPRSASLSLSSSPKWTLFNGFSYALNGPIPQNGALVNRGPTAFIGNPGLCGPPLKNSCAPDTLGASSPSSFPFMPHNDSSQDNGNSSRKSEKTKGLTKGAVVGTVVGDVIGIFLLGLLFSYFYSRVCDFNHDQNVIGVSKGRKGSNKECFYFQKDKSEALFNHVEQYDLVPLDSQVAFDLDELLKASAFVLGKSGIGIMYKLVLEDELALMVRRLGEGGSQRFKEFQTEVEAIGKLRHLNIVTLGAYYWSVDEKLLIYDYIPNGSLAAAIHGKPGLVTF
ncbi:hypothetical protein HN51_065827 [Arachis hypogaea]|uniref:receptor protein kinase-like protein ZAR1 n=1 Tax=Arachis ipaensis TaxID=130454 RepID=UPI000A2B98DB|nr:receptor protein kinase-like protein ZAR1 [Arachis ipaensis]